MEKKKYKLILEDFDVQYIGSKTENIKRSVSQDFSSAFQTWIAFKTGVFYSTCIRLFVCVNLRQQIFSWQVTRQNIIYNHTSFAILNQSYIAKFEVNANIFANLKLQYVLKNGFWNCIFLTWTKASRFFVMFLRLGAKLLVLFMRKAKFFVIFMRACAVFFYLKLWKTFLMKRDVVHVGS